MRLIPLFLLAASTLAAAQQLKPAMRGEAAMRAESVARAEAVPRAVAVQRPLPPAPAYGLISPETDPSIATLRPGDTFEMRLSGMPVEFAQEFTQAFNVGSEGNVNIPLIGPIRAAGFTPAALERAIQQRLITERIFTRPTVVVTVATTARSVTVGGGVKNPQRLQWSPDLTLKTAIDLSGGLDDYSSGKNVRLIRAGRVLGTFNYKKMNDPAMDPKVLPGDQVDVPKS